MNIHEYQGKILLKKFGVPVPEGYSAMSVDEAIDGAKKLGGPVWVVKSQIHAGGRGKGGGVKVVKVSPGVFNHAHRSCPFRLFRRRASPAF